MQTSEEFNLSIAAQNVEAQFYNKLAIVYVEGNDDKLFWAQFFDGNQFEIRTVDGCKNLKDYENEILYHGLKCIVAKDADYSSYKGSESTHPLIVCTLSHSIECVMYCPYNVNACLKKFARSLEDHLAEILQCYNDFFTDTKELLIYDIANNVFGLGCSVCGDSCMPVMESNHSVKVSTEKRDRLLQQIASAFPPEKVEKARQLLNDDQRTLRQITKGHFQTSFVMNLLKKLTSQITGDKSPSISNDALYALLITCFPSCQVDCEERKILRQRAAAATAAL